MGIERFNLAAALKCVTAQRLAKRICRECIADDQKASQLALVELGIHPNYLPHIKPKIGVGCEACEGLGTKGRVAVHEVMSINSALQDAILEGKSATEIKRISLAARAKSLRLSALTKMARGEISVAEVVRVSGSDWDVHNRDAYLQAYHSMQGKNAS